MNYKYFRMKVITLSTLRSKIKHYFDEVINSSSILVIPSSEKDDDEAIVIISLRVYNLLQETNYILSTYAHRIQLMESNSQSKSGDVNEVNID